MSIPTRVAVRPIGAQIVCPVALDEIVMVKGGVTVVYPAFQPLRTIPQFRLVSIVVREDVAATRVLRSDRLIVVDRNIVFNKVLRTAAIKANAVGLSARIFIVSSVRVRTYDFASVAMAHPYIVAILAGMIGWIARPILTIRIDIFYPGVRHVVEADSAARKTPLVIASTKENKR